MNQKTRHKRSNPPLPPCSTGPHSKRDDSGVSLESVSSLLGPIGKGVYTSDEFETEEECEFSRDSVFSSPGAPVISVIPTASASFATGKTQKNGHFPPTTPRIIPHLEPKESEKRPKDAKKKPNADLGNHCEEILKKLSQDPALPVNQERVIPKNAVFVQFKTRVRHLFESARCHSAERRRKLYRQVSFLEVFDEMCLSIYRIRAMVDIVFELVGEKPEFCVVCAEFLKAQIDLMGPEWRPSSFAAILRASRSYYLQRCSPFITQDEHRRRRFVYSTLLGHLYVVRLLPSAVIRKYVTEVIQPGRDETEIDGLTYAVRLLSIIGWTWDSEGGDHPQILNEWFCLLARIVNCPPPLTYDVQRLLAQRPLGVWKFGSYDRADGFETRQPLDDVVFRTRNSFGRGLHASKELLASFSPYFHKFFFTRGRSLQKEEEQHEVFIGVEFYVFREILSILYSVNRVFTPTNHIAYDTPTLVQLYHAATQLDVPLVRRMCREQLQEKPPLEGALVAQQLGMKEIVSNALRRMCPRDMRLFLEHGNGQALLPAQDVFTAVRKIVPLKHRKLKPPPLCQTPPEDWDTMFPSDFLTPWPLGDVIIKTWNSGGNGLYANATVLSLFSQSFARNIRKHRKTNKTGEAIEIPVELDFLILSKILKTIHHVDRKFSFGDHVAYGPAFLFDLLKAACILEMPIIFRLCEDQFLSLPSGGQFSIAEMAGVPKEILADCCSPEFLIEEIRKAVRQGLTPQKHPRGRPRCA